MRAVIDTNVLMAGLLWRGPSHALLEPVRAGSVSLVRSPVLLAELAEVIGRAKFDAILTGTNASRERMLAEVRCLAEIIEPPPLPRPVCRDPNDDKVLALALAAKVECIVSGDKDLLSLSSFEGVSVLAPADAIALVEARGKTRPSRRGSALEMAPGQFNHRNRSSSSQVELTAGRVLGSTRFASSNVNSMRP